MQRRFWRRVHVWDNQWVVIYDKAINAWDAFECNWEGASWCRTPEPYVYEQWWALVTDTIGTGFGSWAYLGGRINWGINPKVN